MRGEEGRVPGAVVCVMAAGQTLGSKENKNADGLLTVEGEDGDLAIRAGAGEDWTELMWCPRDCVDCCVSDCLHGILLSKL